MLFETMMGQILTEFENYTGFKPEHLVHLYNECRKPFGTFAEDPAPCMFQFFDEYKKWRQELEEDYGL
jgi:hypothetical protein